MTRDQLGQAAYEAFRGVMAEYGAAYKAWEDLPESCKEANRRAAEAAIEAAHAAGVVVRVTDYRQPAAR